MCNRVSGLPRRVGILHGVLEVGDSNPIRYDVCPSKHGAAKENGEHGAPSRLWVEEPGTSTPGGLNPIHYIRQAADQTMDQRIKGNPHRKAANQECLRD